LKNPQTFRPLGEVLTAAAAAEFRQPESLPEPESTGALPAHEEEDLADALRAARLFRAAVSEAVAFGAARILEDLACDVLARELETAPADLNAVVDRALTRFAREEPICVRVHPSESAIAAAFPVVADPSLRPGDAVIELHCGSVDATLGARLAAVLHHCSS
jgi:hypothetical protein